MPRNYFRCKDCSKDDVPLSRNGLCFSCARKRMEKGTWEMKNKSGEYYEKHVDGIIAYAERLRKEREERRRSLDAHAARTKVIE